jgi:hypothetical protein
MANRSFDLDDVDTRQRRPLLRQVPIEHPPMTMMQLDTHPVKNDGDAASRELDSGDVVCLSVMPKKTEKKP